MLIKISAIGLVFPAIAVFLVNRLVNIIPDKTALIQRFRICQICIFVHGPTGISHSVCIFATDKRLASVFFQKSFDVFHCGVHLAFHIAGIIVTSVMHNTFIVHQTSGVFLSVEPGHLINIFSTKGFVSTRPDEDTWMVFISLVHRIYAVQHHRKPFRSVTGHYAVIFPASLLNSIPGTMAFQIVFCNHIKSVFITQIINHSIIWIMTGSDGVNVILFHGDNIFYNIFPCSMTSCKRTEFVAVYTLKDYSLSVKHHKIVFHLKMPESHFLRNHLFQLSVCIPNLQKQIIKYRCLRTPEFWFFHIHMKNCFLLHFFFQSLHSFPVL